jgi:hypothetical protein
LHFPYRRDASISPLPMQDIRSDVLVQSEKSIASLPEALALP